MELEFDKEIDALMRAKGRSDRGILVGDAAAHLDADELAAFAENAMPERVRSLHMTHLADCDRCRRILSGLIALNAEAEPEKAAVAAPSIPAVADLPWYKKLFLFPNLAYVMGGLVLLFGGLIGVTLLQSSLGDGAATVSQSVETPGALGPMEPAAASDATANVYTGSANATNTMATANSNTTTTAANTASNTAVARESLPAGETVAMATPAPDAIADGVSGRTSPAAVPPPPGAKPEQPKDLKVAEAAPVTSSVEDDRKEEAKKRAADEQEKADLSLARQQAARNSPGTQAGGPMKSKPGPSRDAQQNFPNRADNTYAVPESRRVGGKEFQFRNGAWYDNSYRGQATTNVRRGTEEYRKLDGGLRSIAERLNGVVVAVWDGKAYRIQ